MLARASDTQGGRWLGKDARALVRETHHRVSNHLQILAGLVGLQAREHPQAMVREALMEVQRRILAIARLNTALQQAEDSEVLEISRLLGALREDLRTCFGADEGPLRALDFDIETADMPAETGLTLMLIVNELVTNAVKHAATGDGIGVSLRRQPQGDWELTVRDGGPGPPPDAFTRQDHGLGLIQHLVRTLRGAISVEPVGGGEGMVCVRFY